MHKLPRKFRTAPEVPCKHIYHKCFPICVDLDLLCYKKSTACLMSIKQREDETLRSYIARFNKEALSIDNANDKILVVA